jgi:hypothetical protein
MPIFIVALFELMITYSFPSITCVIMLGQTLLTKENSP